MKKNLVLIGMMGSGKSTIGREISKKTALKLIDTDQLIENHEKKVARFNKKKRRNALLGDFEGYCEFNELDDIYDEAEGGGACVTCYK